MDALRDTMERLGAEFLAYGPAEAGVEVAEDFGAFEAEYGAIRRTVGVLHLPQRGVIELRGGDVAEFLHRLVTQDVTGMAGGATRRALQLDAKGNLLADLIVHRGDASTWVEADVFDVPALLELFDGRLFGEDVELNDASAERACFALLGPAAAKLIDAVRDSGAASKGGDESATGALVEGTHHVLTLAGRRCTVYRWDDAGGPGLRVWVPSEHAADVYRALLDTAGFESVDFDAEHTNDDEAAAFAERRRAGLRGRPVGWSAYNTARVEAGVPVFHIDFGPTNLPAEAGVVDEAVSFTKGCFPGQEAVARMRNLGHPKKLLVGLRLPGEAIPVAGTQAFDPGDGATVVGAVTSSAVSPLRGSKGVAIAMVRWGKHEPGGRVVVVAGEEKVEAEVAALDQLARVDAPAG